MSGDARSAGGGWTLRTICVLGAAAMTAAGVYLFDPAPANLGLYVERGKYALAGYTLIYAALLVAFAATAGALRTGSTLANYALSFVAGPIALFALGFLFTALAVDAYFYRDPANYWVALLAIPAALCFAASLLSEIAEKKAGADTVGNDEHGLLGGLLVVAFYFVVALAAVVIYINAGYLLFYLLQANLLDGNDIDLSRIGPALATLLLQVAAERWQFVLIIGTIGALLTYGFATLVSWAGRAPGNIQQQALEPQDAAFIERCAKDLRAYAEAKGYSRDAKRVLWLVVLPSLFVPMLLAFVAGFNLHNWVPRPYDPASLDLLGWHIYERSIGPSAIAILFVGIFWSVIPNALLARVSRSYSEMAGWAGFASKEPTISLEAYLTGLFRTGRLAPGQPFDPGKMLHYINTSWEPVLMYPAVLVTFVAAIAWHHDMSRYHVLTETYVEVMRYWTLEKQRYPYSAIRGVALECRIDDGRPAPAYDILLPEGFSVDLFDKKNFADHVNDLARVEALIPAGVPRTFATREGQSVYDPICVEVLAADLPEEDAVRLRAVFRTEDWHRARWQERIGMAK